MMANTEAQPGVAAVREAGAGDDEGWAALMTEILAGLAALDGIPGLTRTERAELKGVYLEGLQRSAAERRRDMTRLRRITGHT
jgi:hypothetical protein